VKTEVGLREVIIHAWSWLNYKPVYSNVMTPVNRGTCFL
jgi:hypothetical protein